MSEITDRLNATIKELSNCTFPSGLHCECDPEVGAVCEICSERDLLMSALMELNRLQGELDKLPYPLQPNGEGHWTIECAYLKAISDVTNISMEDIECALLTAEATDLDAITKEAASK